MIEALIILAALGGVWFFFYAPKKIKTVEKENTDVKYVYTLKEIELIDKINSHRVSLGLSNLRINNYVTSKCFSHNSNMAEQKEVTHNGFVSRSEIITNSLGAKSVGENIAYGFTSTTAILNAWLNSPSHKKNLENPKWTEMGLSITDKYVTNIFIC